MSQKLLFCLESSCGDYEDVLKQKSKPVDRQVKDQVQIRWHERETEVANVKVRDFVKGKLAETSKVIVHAFVCVMESPCQGIFHSLSCIQKQMQHWQSKQRSGLKPVEKEALKAFFVLSRPISHKATFSLLIFHCLDLWVLCPPLFLLSAFQIRSNDSEQLLFHLSSQACSKRLREFSCIWVCYV